MTPIETPSYVHYLGICLHYLWSHPFAHNIVVIKPALVQFIGPTTCFAFIYSNA